MRTYENNRNTKLVRARDKINLCEYPNVRHLRLKLMQKGCGHQSTSCCCSHPSDEQAIEAARQMTQNKQQHSDKNSIICTKYIKNIVHYKWLLGPNNAWYSFHVVKEKEHLFRWYGKESWRRQRNCRDRKFLQLLHLDFERDAASVRLQVVKKRWKKCVSKCVCRWL
jgi:hypothetical protein